MSTFNAFYVRKKATDKATRTAMLSLYPDACIETFDDFIGALLDADDLEPRRIVSAAGNGRHVGDFPDDGRVVHLSPLAGREAPAGSGVRGHRRRMGTSRGTGRGMGGGAVLEQRSLEDVPQRGRHVRCPAQELEKMWSGRALVKGSEFPVAGDDTAVHTIMEHYGFGYSGGAA